MRIGFASLLFCLMASASAASVSASQAWPLEYGAAWIYEGTVQWAISGTSKVKSAHIHWTNSVAWSGSNQRWHVSVVRNPLGRLAWYEPGSENSFSVCVATTNQIYAVFVKDRLAAERLAQELVSRNSPLPASASLQLELPLTPGRDFGADNAREDHWYCWHIAGVETRRLNVPGLGRDAKSEVALLEYRTLPDHQLIEFAPGVGILKYQYAHHGTVASADVSLVEFRPPKKANSNSIRISEVILFGDMDCFKIETPTATYFYGKRGAGFVSILDNEGRDWISYRPGGKALGEYRGLPKCGQPTKFFHCGYGYGQYTNNNWFTSRIARESPEHIRIESETRNHDSACSWDFFPTHATLTLQRIGQPNFWFLYEGTPGGELEVDKDFVLRPGGRRTLLNEPWSDEVEWVCFGRPRSTRGLLFISHGKQKRSASYVSWPYKPESDGALNQMTVFGFGRPPWTDAKQHQPQLRDLPARFTIAVTERTDISAVEHLVEKLK